MLEDAYNPNDPNFLLSRELDGDLSDSERHKLDAALRGSASLRAEQEQLRQVARLVQRWAAEPVRVDGDHAAAIRQKLLAREDSQESFERLLRQWASDQPNVNADAFAASVLQKIRRSPRERSKARISPAYRFVLRTGMPLAAAAAVVFAVTVAFWNPTVPSPECIVNIGPSSHSLSFEENGSDARLTVVAFNRVDIERSLGTVSGLSIMAVGSDPAALEEELPPL